MPNLEVPKSFDEFVDARKAGFIHVKDYVENGGHLVGIFCSYTPLELFDAAFISGTSPNVLPIRFVKDEDRMIEYDVNDVTLRRVMALYDSEIAGYLGC